MWTRSGTFMILTCIGTQGSHSEEEDTFPLPSHRSKVQMRKVSFIDYCLPPICRTPASSVIQILPMKSSAIINPIPTSMQPHPYLQKHVQSNLKRANAMQEQTRKRDREIFAMLKKPSVPAEPNMKAKVRKVN